MPEYFRGNISFQRKPSESSEHNDRAHNILLTGEYKSSVYRALDYMATHANKFYKETIKYAKGGIHTVELDMSSNGAADVDARRILLSNSAIKSGFDGWGQDIPLEILISEVIVHETYHIIQGAKRIPYRGNREEVCAQQHVLEFLKSANAPSTAIKHALLMLEHIQTTHHGD